MATELKMPQMGYDMEEGTVVRWLKEEGATVEKNEAVAEIETDKAVVEFESESEGVLISIIAPEGTVVPVGETIALIGYAGESAAQIVVDTVDAIDEPEQPDEIVIPAPQESPPLEPAPAKTGTRIIATPIARRIADEMGISLSNVVGSGPGGRITKRDVETSESTQGVQTTEEPTPSEIHQTEAETKTDSLPSMSSGDKVPLSRMRQQIARVTVRSKTEKPHFYVSAEIDMSKAMELRKQVNNQLADQGVRVTVNDLIIKASIEALKNYPKFNSYYEEDGIQKNEAINIAIAIAEEEGLIVPAILNCGDKSLRQISEMVKDLAKRSSDGTLSPQEYTGGTFAISNLGMYDVSSFVAIIHPPQSAVLAVGTVSQKPVVKDGEITIGQVMTATLSADHRIVDGAEGAEFLIQIKGLLESPMGLIL
ncbi:2-oxo acid dehydrogenase subunit E2 [Dehalococcoidia bacterium]|nr:2-oxo acid dehydrogenase subunit E2 [Dehalococcoidia bacterium]